MHETAPPFLSITRSSRTEGKKLPVVSQLSADHFSFLRIVKSVPRTACLRGWWSPSSSPLDDKLLWKNTYLIVLRWHSSKASRGRVPICFLPSPFLREHDGSMAWTVHLLGIYPANLRARSLVVLDPFSSPSPTRMSHLRFYFRCFLSTCPFPTHGIRVCSQCILDHRLDPRGAAVDDLGRSGPCRARVWLLRKRTTRIETEVWTHQWGGRTHEEAESKRRWEPLEQRNRWMRSDGQEGNQSSHRQGRRSASGVPLLCVCHSCVRLPVAFR